MAIWTYDLTLDMLHERNNKTLADFLGIRFIEIGDDYLVATMPVNEMTRQPIGVLHGGASVVLAETLASNAARYVVDDDHYIVGSEINANHLRPAREGLIKGITKPIRIGKTQHVWSIDLFNEQGQQTCVSRMTATVLKRDKEK